MSKVKTSIMARLVAEGFKFYFCCSEKNCCKIKVNEADFDWVGGDPRPRTAFAVQAQRLIEEAHK